MNKWIVKIDTRLSTDWVVSSSTSWFMLSKTKAQELVEVLGPDDFELVEFEGTDNVTIYSTYTVPKNNFWVIRSKSNPKVNFYIYKSTSDIRFSTWNFNTNAIGMTNAWVSGSYVSYIYVRKVSKDLIMFHGQNYAYGSTVIAKGVDQDGNAKMYAISITNGTTLYYYCFETERYNTCVIVPGLFNAQFADFLGLQKITIPEWGIVFDDAFFVTHAPDQYIKLVEMDNIFYALSAGYVSSSNLFQIAVKYPE